MKKNISFAIITAMLAASVSVPVSAAAEYEDWDCSAVTIPGNAFYFDDRSDGCMTASRQPSGSIHSPEDSFIARSNSSSLRFSQSI